MKKTILVSVLTSIITVVLCFLVIHLVCDDCYEDEECEKHEIVISKHGGHGHGQDFVWHGKGHMGFEEWPEECKKIRSEFDEELSEEEKETIAKVKASFKDFKENKEVEDHEQLIEDHKADFETLEKIAEAHKESIDAYMEKCPKHCEKKCEGEKKEECKKKCEGEKKEECEKKCEGEKKEEGQKKCEGYKYDAECKKKCDGEKRVEVIVITEEDGENIEKKERKVMLFGGDHENMCRVHFLLMDFEEK